MTENKRFERIYEDVDVFCRDHNAKGISQLIERDDYDRIVDLLNELSEENQDLRILLNQCSDQRNEFHRGARENANRVGQLEKENKELKYKNEILSDELEQCKAVIDKKWSEYLKKKME